MLVLREVNAASRCKDSDTRQPRIYILTTVKSVVIPVIRAWINDNKLHKKTPVFDFPKRIEAQLFALTFLRIYILAWENSLHFATLQLVSPRNDVWRTDFLLMIACEQALHLGEPREVTWEQHAKGDASARVSAFSRGSPRSPLMVCVISMEFLRSFLRRHFAGKQVVASRNVDCFLRLQTILFLSLITGGALSFQEHHNWC